MHSKIVIGITGEKGGGKETIGDILIRLLAPKKVVRVRSSDILAETLALWGIPSNRHNLQYMAIIMNRQYGLGTLSSAVKRRIESLDADIVLFDGVRWESDFELVRAFPHNYLVYITATPEVRYERIKQRKQKVGEGSVTFEKFLEEEQVETEIHISKLGKSADFIIHNDGSLEDATKSVEKFVLTLK